MKNPCRVNQKRMIDRRFFYTLGLLAVGLFALAWFYADSYPPEISQFGRGGALDKGELFWSIFFLTSFITIIIGLFFVPKSLLVWVVLGLLLIPHVFFLLILTGLGEGSLFQSIISAVRVYLFVISFGWLG